MPSKNCALPDLGDGVWVPVLNRIIVKRQPLRKETSGGIVLPDKAALPQTWGQVLKISDDMQKDFDNDCPVNINVLDYVIYDPTGAVPIDFESFTRLDKVGSNADLFILEAQDILAVFRPGEKYGV